MRFAGVGLALACTVAACGGGSSRPIDAGTDAAADAETDSGVTSQQLIVLGTADLHANLMPYDYFVGRERQNIGLAKIATLVARERAASPCVVLVDSGDTIQGTPLGARYASATETTTHPVALAMNQVGFDAMALGNHEFNFGLPALDRFIRDARFPVLAANVRKASDGSEAYGSYVVKDVCGVKVGILGLVTPVVRWNEPADRIAGLRFDEIVDVARTYVPLMRAAGVEVVIVAVHTGPSSRPAEDTAAGWLSDPAGWVPYPGQRPGNHVLLPLLDVEGIDVVMAGHAHYRIPKIVRGTRIAVEPGANGNFLARVTIDLERRNGTWTVTAQDSSLLPVDASVPADPALVAALEPYHQGTLSYLSTVVGQATGPLPGSSAGVRLFDGALADLINEAQKEAANRLAKDLVGRDVDASATAIFGPTGLAAGPVTLMDLYRIYPYDNTLTVVELTGAQLETALETNAAMLEASSPLPMNVDLLLTGPGYNYDIYSDVEYTVDLSQPVGSRITALSLNGSPISATQSLLLAVNNFRAGGDGNATFRNAILRFSSPDGVRDYVVEYVRSHATIDPATIGTCNYHLVPRSIYDNYFPGVAPRCP